MSLSTAARIALLNGLVLSLLTLAKFWGILKFPLLFSYQWHKVLHLIGVVLFMGNMIVGPVWFLFARYSSDLGLLRFAGRLLYLTDLYFTVPGIALTVLNGLCMASALGGSSTQPWLFYSIVAMIVMWVLSIPLVFLQEKLFKTIAEDADNEVKINQLLVQWGVLGTLVTIPPSLVFYWMVMKAV